MSDELPHRLSELVDASTPDTLPPFAHVTQRRNGRRARRRGIAASAAAVVLVAGTVAATSMLTGSQDAEDPSPVAPTVASSSASGPTATPNGATLPDEPPEWDDANPPPVVLHLDDRKERLAPWTSCYLSPEGQASCRDGMPTPPFVDVGSRNSVPFAFPLQEWTFQASFTPLADSRCERSITVDAIKTGRYTFEVPLAGPPGEYQVDLFGRGPEGDVITTFSWATRERGTIPPPTGYLGVVGGDKEELVFYWPELGLQDIADLSERPSAVVTVTAANGESLTMPRLLADPSCFSEGHVWFRGPESASAGVGDLGPPPYHYTVDLVLDGTRYKGTGLWPRDEQFGNEPYVTLQFSPPLPGYSG